MPSSQRRRAPLYTSWDERYQIVRKIGAGGFANVFEAVDLETGGEVAVKVVQERGALAGRILREVEAAQTLDHPAVVALLDYFSDGERSFLVWELVHGQSLAELGGELHDEEAVLAVARLCDALAYAHSMGVVHRDIKPHNVMIDLEGDVKVMDFGIARLIDAETLTTDGEMLGTVAYMSPEQAAGRRVGPPTDVYSAGLLLYELLAGRNPVRGSTPAETVGNVLAARIPPLEKVRPDLPAALTEAVAAACATTAAERPTAGDLAEILREAAEGVGRRRVDVGRLLSPLTHLRALGERGLGAALAFVAVFALVALLPAYPAGWRLALAGAAAAVWFLLPRLGLAVLLGGLAFPLFDVSLVVGLAYLVFAVAAFLVARGLPLGFLWAVLAVALTPFHAALIAPATAGLVFGRRLGPLVAAWAGVATYAYLRLAAASGEPFAAYQPRDGLVRRMVEADGPFDVGGLVLGTAVSWPAAFQMAVWAGLALAIALAVRLRTAELRLWVWAGAFAATFALYRVVPVEVWRLPATHATLVWSTVIAAAATFTPVVMGGPWERAARADDGFPEAAGDEV